MACGLVLDPRQDFPAWLSTQGVNSHVAQAVERELGIGDYEALLACAESAQVRSELFVLARERLSFATYAVLRRAIEGLASRRSGAVEVAQGFDALGLHPFLSGLLDSMVVLLTSVSQDLSHSAQRLRSLEPTLYGEVAEATSSLSQGYAVSDPGVTGPEDMYRYDVVEEEEDESLVDQKPPASYAEECNEIGAVEQQIPEASLNEQMIGDESQTIGSIVGRSSEHLLDVRFVKREPSAVGNGAAESQGKLSAAGGASDAEWVVTEPEHRLCEPRTQYFVSREDAESRPRSNTDFAVSASWTSGPSASFPSEWQGTFWPRLQADIENEVVEADVHEQQKREREKARRQFVCKMCLQVYSCEKYLRRHIQMHTGTRPFSCRECGRAFLHSSDLRVHMRIHTGEQPFRCQDCGRRFSRSFNLARHRKTHASFSKTSQQNEFCK